jgi:hypothetical protein
MLFRRFLLPIVSLTVHHLIKPPALQLLSFLTTFLISSVIELKFESVANGFPKVLAVIESIEEVWWSLPQHVEPPIFHRENARPIQQKEQTC